MDPNIHVERAPAVGGMEMHRVDGDELVGKLTVYLASDLGGNPSDTIHVLTAGGRRAGRLDVEPGTGVRWAERILSGPSSPATVDVALAALTDVTSPHAVSAAIRSAIEDYASGERGITTTFGGFMEKLLAGDMVGAVEHADYVNKRTFAAIVYYARDVIPAEAWGTPARVAWWRDRGCAIRNTEHPGTEVKALLASWRPEVGDEARDALATRREIDDETLRRLREALDPTA